MKTIILKTGDDLTFAADVIKSGGVAGMPTETVYGLAADGFNPSAVGLIYELKGRPGVKPLSLLVSGTEMAASVCSVFPETARRLAEAFWPGPLTIVLPCRDAVPGIVTAGGSTVGVRCPDQPETLELIRLVSVPLAAPSANPSGEESPKCAEDVIRYFDGKIACVIDGGPCKLGVESTIVSLAGDATGSYKILRYGALTKEQINHCL